MGPVSAAFGVACLISALHTAAAAAAPSFESSYYRGWGRRRKSISRVNGGIHPFSLEVTFFYMSLRPLRKRVRHRLPASAYVSEDWLPSDVSEYIDMWLTHLIFFFVIHICVERAFAFSYTTLTLLTQF